MITQERIDEIKARDASATPGPWQWRFYGGKEDPQLTAPHSGLLCIMDFVRRGMHGAEPRFANRTEKDRGGIMYALSHWWKRHTDLGVPIDASFIAHARQDVTDLLAEVERLQGVVSTQQGAIEDIRSDLASIAVRALSYQVTGCPEHVLHDIHAWAKRLSKPDDFKEEES